LADHEQDHTPVNGPAGTESRNGEDEGTFRWPSTRLPRLFGQQSADEEEPPDTGTDRAPPAESAADWQHALRAAPPSAPDAAPDRQRAPFSPVTYGHLLRSRPAPDAGEESGGEQPPWPPAPPPGQDSVPPPRQESAPGQVPLPVREPEQAAQPTGAAQPAEAAQSAAAQPAGAAQPAEAAAQPTWPAQPTRVAEPVEAQSHMAGPAPSQAQNQMAGPVPAEAQNQVADPAPAEAHDLAEGASPAEAHSLAEAASPAEVYGPAAAYEHEEYDPPDDYPMAEYDIGATGPAPGPALAPPEAPPQWQQTETAESLTADMLLPGRHTVPPSGWRRAIYRATGGVVRPPLSASEMHRRELIARACTPVSGGHHRVAVLSLKGGVGKTTTVMGLGSTLASLRGDRVIAVDANPDRGTLSDKLRLETPATIRDLLNERAHIQRYADVRSFTTQAPSRLEVLASDRDPTVSVAFSDQDYEDVTQVLEHYYSICITDCGTGLLHSAMAGVLRLADQIVLVSSPSVDGARSASATLDWLQAHGYGDLVSDAVVVLSVIRPRSKSTIDLGRLEQHFAARSRAVIRIPHDAHLEEGAEVELDQLSKATAEAYLALAAEVGDGFNWPRRVADF
jgi:MinD-like ATPase involved in chromosome partitioning or flagellar assembly